MSGILCALRGGPDSQDTVDYAIHFAKEKKQRLYFLYVVNLNFLSGTSQVRRDNVAQELHRMGEFILLMAQSRAATLGVRADNLVRRGSVPEQILKACKEIDVKYLLMGRPQNDSEVNIFDSGELEDFAQKAMEDCGAKVILKD